jgi:UPF0755 protein
MFKKRILFSSLIVLVVLIIVFSYQSVFSPVDSLAQEEIIFEIEKGQSSKEIALNLEEQGLIKSSFVFRFYALINGTIRNLKAGQYSLSRSMNVVQIADKINKGEIVTEKITVIEGWNSREIASLFEENDIFSADEFLKAIEKDYSAQFSFLEDKPKDLNLEGYLFPDTYEMIKQEKIDDFIKKMLGNFDKKLTEGLRQEIVEQDKTIFDIIVIASLIEKEVKTIEDKKMVSDVLWKRLDIGMPLQVDATIAYFLKAEKWSFDQMRREIHLAREIDSPYNTYKYRGLPLGPISNPGLDSIKAALYPSETDFWYYLSTPQGETVFNETLAEHNITRAKYLQ